jgi:nucleoside-diphosphate-sugar epimerase
MVHGPDDPYRRLSAYLKRMDDGRPAIVLDEVMARLKCPRGFVEDVAVAIDLAIEEDRAAGRVYNVAGAVAFTEAEWVGKIGECAGWRGHVLTVPAGRIALPYDAAQSLATDSMRIRRELRYAEVIPSRDALEQTIAW